MCSLVYRKFIAANLEGNSKETLFNLRLKTINLPFFLLLCYFLTYIDELISYVASDFDHCNLIDDWLGSFYNYEHHDCWMNSYEILYWRWSAFFCLMSVA